MTNEMRDKYCQNDNDLDLLKIDLVNNYLFNIFLGKIFKLNRNMFT